MKNFYNLLQSTNINFDVIAITETKIPKNVSVTQNIVFNNYSFEHIPTDSDQNTDSKFDQENFISDYFDIDWSNHLNLNEKNVD